MLALGKAFSFCKAMPINFAFILVSCCLAVSHSTAQVSPESRAALLQLYSQMNGPNWNINTGWLGPVGSECDWHGLFCRDQEIVAIELDLNNLSGSLSEALFELQSLEVISLEANQIEGTIPDLWAQLPNLRFLDLAQNNLQGPVPDSIAQSLIRLLSLSNNQLSGELDSIPFSPPLEGLWIDQNQMSGSIGVNIAALPNLKYLYAQNNNLQGILAAPTFLSSQLEELSLANNEIMGNLPEFALPTDRLVFLDFSNNQFVDDFGEWVNSQKDALSSVQVMLFDQNNLTGSIPSSLSSLINLRELRLTGNSLDGVLEQDAIPNQPIIWRINDNPNLSGTLSEKQKASSLIGFGFIDLENTSIEVPDCQIARTIDGDLESGDFATVRLWVSDLGVSTIFALTDYPPPDWEIFSRSCSCAFDDGSIVFPIVLGDEARVYRYSVRVGEASFDESDLQAIITTEDGQSTDISLCEGGLVMPRKLFESSFEGA